MPLFGDRVSSRGGGERRTSASGPRPTLLSLGDPKNRNAFHPATLPSSTPSTRFSIPLAFMDRGEDDTSAGVRASVPSAVTTPRPSRNRNEAWPARAAPSFPPPRVAPPLLKTKISSSSAPSWPATRRKPLEIVRSLLLEGRRWVDLCLSLSLSLQRMEYADGNVGWIFDGIK